jgi:hypothetical protein
LGGEAISNAPVTVGERLYVQSDSGTLAAFGIQAPKEPKSAPKKAAEPDEDSAAEGA